MADVLGALCSILFIFAVVTLFAVLLSAIGVDDIEGLTRPFEAKSEDWERRA